MLTGYHALTGSRLTKDDNGHDTHVANTLFKTATTTTTTATASTATTNIASITSWVGGTAYATRLYNFAQAGGLTAAATDELGRDFQVDLGGLVAEPNAMTLDSMFGQMDRQLRMTKQPAILLLFTLHKNEGQAH